MNSIPTKASLASVKYAALIDESGSEENELPLGRASRNSMIKLRLIIF
jgi:hypothetical protein